MRAAALSAVFAYAFVGCVSITYGKNLQRESARAITPTPNPDSVQISDLQGGVTSAKWVATTPSGVYDCSIRTAERRPLCARRETPR